MTRKTASLAYPADPLAAIRELQELDARPAVGQGGARGRTSVPGPTPAPRPLPPPEAAAPPPMPATSSAVANAGGSDGSSAASSADRGVLRPRPGRPADRPPVESARHEPGGK